ncbi:MAG TPA: hypothetical protein VMF05_14960 [Stellaceae bacterium]|nr:hypothetical protein [Stellaceae bacterium]
MAPELSRGHSFEFCDTSPAQAQTTPLANYLVQWTCNDGSLPYVSNGGVTFTCNDYTPQTGAMTAYWRKHDWNNASVEDSTEFYSPYWGWRYRKTESIHYPSGTPGINAYGYCSVACVNLSDGGDIQVPFYGNGPGGTDWVTYTLTQGGGLPLQYFDGPYCSPQQYGWFGFDSDTLYNAWTTLSPDAKISGTYNGPTANCNALATDYTTFALTWLTWPMKFNGVLSYPSMATIIAIHESKDPGSPQNAAEIEYFGYDLGLLRWASWCTSDTPGCVQDPDLASTCPNLSPQNFTPVGDGKTWYENDCHSWTDIEPETGATQTMPTGWSVDSWGWPGAGN